MAQRHESKSSPTLGSKLSSYILLTYISRFEKKIAENAESVKPLEKGRSFQIIPFSKKALVKRSTLMGKRAVLSSSIKATDEIKIHFYGSSPKEEGNRRDIPSVTA